MMIFYLEFNNLQQQKRKTACDREPFPEMRMANVRIIYIYIDIYL